MPRRHGKPTSTKTLRPQFRDGEFNLPQLLRMRALIDSVIRERVTVDHERCFLCGVSIKDAERAKARAIRKAVRKEIYNGSRSSFRKTVSAADYKLAKQRVTRICRNLVQNIKGDFKFVIAGEGKTAITVLVCSDACRGKLHSMESNWISLASSPIVLGEAGCLNWHRSQWAMEATGA